MTDFKNTPELSESTEPAIAHSTCYRLPFLSLFHADCMEIMKQYPDKYFDLAIVDPPFSTGRGNGNFGRGGKNSKQPKVYRKDLKNYANHNKCPDKEYFEELFRVSKNQIIWGANYYPQYLYHSGWILWDKCKKDGIMSQGELAFQSIDKKVRIFTHEWEGFRKAKGSFLDGEVKSIIHPNQKPVALYDWCIKEYAKQDCKILDTHLGSASIALSVSKSDMNLHLTACEIDKEYIDKAIKRISESIKQGTLSF